MLKILKDEIYFAFFLEGLLDAHDVVSFEHFEHLYLSLDCFAIELIFVGLFEFLDGDSLC